MAGIEKDINYLEALCDKRPDSPCYFYLPCCRAFYEIQSDKLPSALEHLQKMGVAVNRAKYFVEFESENIFNRLLDEQNLRKILLSGMKSKFQNPFSQQLSLF